MNAQPPANFVRNKSEREIGLLSNRSMAPGSNVCGMIGAVTRIAASTPSVPTKKFIMAATIPLMTGVASVPGERGFGHGPDQVRDREFGLARSRSLRDNAISRSSRFRRFTSSSVRLSPLRSASALVSSFRSMPRQEG